MPPMTALLGLVGRATLQPRSGRLMPILWAGQREWSMAIRSLWPASGCASRAFDAPERRASLPAAAGTRYPCGAEATQALRRRIGRGKVVCTIHGTDRYGPGARYLSGRPRHGPQRLAGGPGLGAGLSALCAHVCPLRKTKSRSPEPVSGRGSCRTLGVAAGPAVRLKVDTSPLLGRSGRDIHEALAKSVR